MRSFQNISADARLDPLSDRKAQGYTDGRVKCRKPVEEPGTVPRVRIGNVVALLIEQKGSGFMSWLLVTMRLCAHQLVNGSIRVMNRLRHGVWQNASLSFSRYGVQTMPFCLDERGKEMKNKMWKLLGAALLLMPLTACEQNEAQITAQGEQAELVTAYLDAVDERYAYEIAETLAYDPAYLSNELGFRTAGSDAEHAAARYIADEMEEIGLEVEQVPVTVDRWQFNDASLRLEGTDIDIMPASYATNGTDEDGITAELVDVGSGGAADYAGKDVEGKIVLAGVDQWNEAWIDQYLHEAELHGAAAIITYDTGGYATYSDEMINMQDVCAEDVMPCVSISADQYRQIAAALEEGNETATLIVDNVLQEEQGTSYNVVGRLKGRSDEQQIIVSGHYDVYFNGFQDDSCAVGLVLAMAKGMADAGYQPENDILFIAHGAEEWGASGTQFDWTTGAWEMINNAHPEWAGKTIAMINFELPAFYDGMSQGQISCVPEFSTLTKTFVETSGLLAEPVDSIYPDGISAESVDTNTMEDGVSYRASGVPYFINIPGTQEGEKGWIQQRYHTVADDRDTYSAQVMQTNLNTFGALAIYLDQTPALALDLNATCDDLQEALDTTLAGEDAQPYLDALDALRNAAQAHQEEIAAINAQYQDALDEKADQQTLDEIRERGRALNAKTLDAFRFVQEQFIGIISTSDIVIKHVAYQNNVDVIEGVIAALEEGVLSNEEGSGALDLAWMINGGAEYGYYSFSTETNAASLATLQEESNPGNLFWGTDKGSVLAQTYPATVSLLEKAESEDGDFTEEIAVYAKEQAQQERYLQEMIRQETDAMQELTQMLGA